MRIQVTAAVSQPVKKGEEKILTFKFDMANGQEPSSDGNGRASSNTELRHSLSHSIHSELGPDSRRPGGQQSTSRPCSPPVLEPTAPPHARGTSREIRLKNYS